jgi:sphingomyelin phosphodiesterase
MNNLAWLVDQLTEAEANGELVHLINHIPPGNPDCLGAWGREFCEIVER